MLIIEVLHDALKTFQLVHARWVGWCSSWDMRDCLKQPESGEDLTLRSGFVLSSIFVADGEGYGLLVTNLQEKTKK